MPSVLPLAADAAVGSLHQTRGADGAITFHRLPGRAVGQIADGRFAAMVAIPAGVRLELHTDAPWLDLDVQLTLLQINGQPLRAAVVDVVVDGVDAGSVRTTVGTHVRVDDARGDADVVPGGPTTLHISGLPGRSDTRVELWLPHAALVELRDVRIPAGCSATAAPQDRPVWIHHGSSISHCLQAARPLETWPALVARQAGVSLLDLGFAGQCHLDPCVARAIRDVPAAAISVKLGVNVVNGDTMRERVFVPAVHGFLDTIRDGHPTTPLLVVTPIVCPPTESVPGPTALRADGFAVAIPRREELGAGSLTMERVRAILAEVVGARRAAGDEDLHLLDGLALFGHDEAELLADGTHPDGAGYHRIADRFHAAAFGPGGPFAAVTGP